MLLNQLKTSTLQSRGVAPHFTKKRSTRIRVDLPKRKTHCLPAHILPKFIFSSTYLRPDFILSNLPALANAASDFHILAL